LKSVTSDLAGYRDYVAAHLDPLRRTAYLLCGDWHTADDLVSTALVRSLRHWRRVSTIDNLDAYVRRILLRTWLNERRRPWRREAPFASIPDRGGGTGPDGVPDRLAIIALLAELPPRRRAVLVLRYVCDLSVVDTAAALGCSTGTVKSQTARALDVLRARLLSAAPIEGNLR
jgi:RNA polymerase sigma-70 factor (sigma-E family)